MTLLKNWAVAFVGLFVTTFVWHNVLLSDFYTTNLSQIGRYTDGTLTPLISFLALGNVLAALGFAVFIPAISKDAKSYALNGLIAGLAITGSFVLFSHGIFFGWTANLAWADFFYGLISGVITGLVLYALNKKTA